ncbi:MAG: discoidin domain-containing protein [Candidatus Omnitrophica bacterium]|nr:discoidin domain-containing protein [Candidatus Omnitrophota bacterium]
MSIKGPNWFMVPNDVSYGYLLQGLSLLEGKPVGILNHPGVTNMTLNAVIIKIVYVFKGTADDIPSDVIYNSELYTSAINYVLLSLNVIAIFIFGIIVYKVFDNIWFGILSQISPFLWRPIQYVMITNGLPESLLLSSGLGLAGAVIWTGKTRLQTDKDRLNFTVLSSLLCGFALATKFHSAPLAVLPFLLLPGNKWRIYFIAGVIFSWLLFMLPVIDQWREIINGFRETMHSAAVENKLRGGEEKNFIEWLFLSSIELKELIPTIAWYLILTTGFCLLLFIFSPRARRFYRDMDQFNYKLLFLTTISLILAWLYISIRPKVHYLFSYAGYIGLATVLCFKILYEIVSHKKYYKTLVYCGIIFLLSFIVNMQLEFINADAMFIVKEKRDAFKNNEILEEKYKDWPVFHTIPFNNKITSLEHANQISRFNFSKIIVSLHTPNTYFYSVDSGVDAFYYRKSGEREVMELYPLLSYLGKGVLVSSGFEKQLKNPRYKAPVNVDLKCSSRLILTEIYEMVPRKIYDRQLKRRIQESIKLIAYKKNEIQAEVTSNLKLNGNFWEGRTNFPVWLRLDLGEDRRPISKYMIATGNHGTDSTERMPKDWEFQASDDGTNWKTLDAQKNQTNWRLNEKRLYRLPLRINFRYYRLWITKGNHPEILRLYIFNGVN